MEIKKDMEMGRDMEVNVGRTWGGRGDGKEEMEMGRMRRWRWGRRGGGHGEEGGMDMEVDMEVGRKRRRT